MKKIILFIAVLSFVASPVLFAEPTATNIESYSSDDHGPCLYEGRAQRWAGDSGLWIKVYYSANACNSYVAYVDGKSTPYAVHTGEETLTSGSTKATKLCHYYIYVDGGQYWFEM